LEFGGGDEDHEIKEFFSSKGKKIDEMRNEKLEKVVKGNYLYHMIIYGLNLINTETCNEESIHKFSQDLEDDELYTFLYDFKYGGSCCHCLGMKILSSVYKIYSSIVKEKINTEPMRTYILSYDMEDGLYLIFPVKEGDKYTLLVFSKEVPDGELIEGVKVGRGGLYGTNKKYPILVNSLAEEKNLYGMFMNMS